MTDPQPTETSPAAWKPRDQDLDFFGLTHVGLVRKENQDHFLFSTLHKTMRVGGTSLPNPELLELPSQRLASFAMVADGVGGHAGGEVASRAAVETITRYATDTMRCVLNADTADEAAFFAALEDGAATTHQAVVTRSLETGGDGGSATTLTAVMTVWPNCYLLHVGDSRCYRLREGRLEQLTRDQTMAQELVDSGVIPADKAPHTRFAHVLSSTMGGRHSRPVVTKHRVQPGDVTLLCSDGLTKHVSDEQIAERLRALTSSEQACQTLVADALAGGGSDNVTVVVLRAIRPEGIPPIL
ncbi:MAG: protein phosphatase 2C domain-containing protein [Gemmatimonadales bacterium]|nr:protein phosphatase 2C domain-containing protein [Gemmatimonadales bacterium]